MDGASKEHFQNQCIEKRKSKPRTEEKMLEYATTARGAYRIKKIYRAMKARK